MKKGLVSLAMAFIVALAMATVSFAAKVDCTVDSVQGNKATMTCEKAGDLKAGEKVKVSSAKKGAVEGC